MNTNFVTRMRRLEQADAANRHQAVVVISGPDGEAETRIAAAYASGDAHPDQLVVYIRKRVFEGAKA